MTNERTLNEIIEEYIEIYGKLKWSPQVFHYYNSLHIHYIKDTIGDYPISALNVHDIEQYYRELLDTPAVRPTKKKPCVTASTIEKVHKFARSAVDKAVKWRYCAENPFKYADIPKVTSEKREVWTSDQFFEACSLCKDDDLLLAMHIAFSCTLRIGEILGLTWNNIDISATALREGNPSLYVEKQIQRVNSAALAALHNIDTYFVFPGIDDDRERTTTLILKTPKTSSSVRKVFIPLTVAALLIKQQERIKEDKAKLGSRYKDYDLVFCRNDGSPIEPKVIENALNHLIKENNLKSIVFHSLRHTSISYKLVTTNGDIKAVQGDSGHSTSDMILNVYSHILDENRAKTARLFEEEFYKKQDIVFQNHLIKAKMDDKVQEDDIRNLEKILQSDNAKVIIELLSRLS